jgi:DNA-binding transcriptional LysR family regulator
MNYYDHFIHDRRIMDLSDLHIFRAVARTGGIIRAAEHLHRVPSNVTTRIKSLEADLGAALFLREGRRLRLSAAGKILLDYADRLLSLAEEARSSVQDGPPRGTLRLGSMESTAAARLPGPLSRFHQACPEVMLELHTGDPRLLVEQVLTAELDAALVAEPVADPRLATLTAFEEELIIVAMAGHPPMTSAKDAAKKTMLAFHQGCPHRKRLESWFAGSGVVPDRVVELGSYHAILGCAIAGMGVALMPRSVLNTYTERARLSVHELSARLRKSRTLLVWRKDTPQANVMALADILRDKKNVRGRAMPA